MKLLYCEHCGDMFQPGSKDYRICECGRVKGRYLNEREVEISPEAISIALDNKSLLRAIHEMRDLQKRTDNAASRNDYREARQGRIDNVWVRPNCGCGNPNSHLIGQARGRQFKAPTDIICE